MCIRDRVTTEKEVGWLLCVLPDQHAGDCPDRLAGGRSHYHATPQLHKLCLLYTSTVPLLDSEESRLRALSIVGRFDGPPDLAAEHDRYLEEAYES